MIGIVPQSLAIYETFTTEENLRFFGRPFTVCLEKIYWTGFCTPCKLSTLRKNASYEHVSKSSGGMKGD